MTDLEAELVIAWGILVVIAMLGFGIRDLVRRRSIERGWKRRQ